MRGTSGREAKICCPLSRSIASAPDPAPAERICAPSALRVARGPAARATAGSRSVAAASSTVMRRSVRAIGQSRVGNPPVGARLRLRSAPRAAIVASMVKRRVLLPTLVAMFVLLGSGQALAAPTWLAGESQDGTEAATGVPADVATDSGGNSVAVWAASTASRRRGPRRLPPPRRAVGRAGEPRRRAQHRCRSSRASPCSPTGSSSPSGSPTATAPAPLGAPSGGRRLERPRHDRHRRLLRHRRAAGERGRDGDRDRQRRRLRRDLHQGAGLRHVRRRGARVVRATSSPPRPTAA